MDAKPCLVCAVPNNAIHFGVEVCRACSSFFRRVTTSGRRYPCRQLNRNCETARNGKLSCRRCRYDKCVAVGMVHDGPLTMRRNKRADLQRNDCSAIDICNEKEQAEKLRLDEPKKAAETIIDRIGREYEICTANREARELAILRRSTDAQRLEHPTKELYTGTANLVMRMNPLTFEETWSTFRKIFPSLRTLPMRDQVAIYRSYLPNFTIVDSFIRTWRAWGTFDEYSMIMVCVCVDLRTPDAWFEQREGGANRDALVKSMALCISDQMSQIVPSLERAQLTTAEMHALFALVLCEIDSNSKISDAAFSLLEAIQSETLADLQRYYREEMGLSDFSTRLGNLLTICHAVKECSRLFRAVFRMQVTLFDVWSTQTQMKDLLL